MKSIMLVVWTIGLDKGMSLFHRLLAADSAGPAFQRAYENSHKALAGLVPLAVVSPQDSAVSKLIDLALVPAIAVHSHVSLNCIVSDYVPMKARGAARYGVLGLSAGAALGLLKLSVMGPGISGTVKKLWD